MEVSFRRVRPDEVGLLCELDVRIFDKDAFDTPDLWEGLETFFILVDGSIVGSVAFRHNTTMSESYEADYVDLPSSIYIVSTGIVPEWQGKGVGIKVKEWQINHARTCGFAKIVTNARASNARSIELNKKFGFQVIRIIPNFYGDEDTVILERKL